MTNTADRYSKIALIWLLVWLGERCEALLLLSGNIEPSERWIGWIDCHRENAPSVSGNAGSKTGDTKDLACSHQ